MMRGPITSILIAFACATTLALLLGADTWVSLLGGAGCTAAMAAMNFARGYIEAMIEASATADRTMPTCACGHSGHDHRVVVRMPCVRCDCAAMAEAVCPAESEGA